LSSAKVTLERSAPDTTSAATKGPRCERQMRESRRGNEVAARMRVRGKEFKESELAGGERDGDPSSGARHRDQLHPHPLATPSEPPIAPSCIA
jgi:hypothetical protein